MPSTPTASGGYEKQGTGENTNAWGARLNVALDMIDARTDGVASTVVTTSWGLTITNYVVSDGLKNVQRMTGTPATDFTVTLPARNLSRWFHNLTGKTATITNGTGANATVRNGQITFVYSDTVNGCFVADPRLDQVKAPSAAVDFNGQKGVNAAAPTANGDLANKGYVDTFTANRSAGNFELVSVADGTTPQSAVNLRQLQAQVFDAGFIPPGTVVGQASVWNGSAFAAGPLDLAAANTVSGVLSDALGGTGAGTKPGARSNLLGDASTNTGKAIVSNGSDWVPASLATNIPVQSKSANYTVVAGDAGTLIECTASLTLALTAAATLGNGFTFFVRVASENLAVTIDPNSTELIDGVQAATGYYGDNLFIVTCDGTSFRTSRCRGVVFVGRTTVGAPVAAVTFETGVADAEMSGARISLVNTTHSVASTMVVTLKKSGSYQSSGYLNSPFTVVAGGSVSAQGQNTSAHTLIQNVDIGSAICGVVELDGINLTAAYGQSIRTRAWKLAGGTFTNNNSQFTDGVQTTAAVVTGVRIATPGANITAGTFYHYAVRG